MNYDEFYLSKSNYYSFKQCPRRFQLSLVKKTGVPSPQMLLGLRFHELAKEAYDDVKFIDNNIKFEEPTITNPELQRMFDNFKSFERVRFALYSRKFGAAAPAKFLPLFTERKIRLPELKIVGVLDFLGLGLDGSSYQIVDYKTSRDVQDKTLSPYKFELCMYKILAESDNIIDGPVKYGTIYFPDINKVLERTYDEKDVNWCFDEINSTKEQIKKCFDSDDFPKCTMWCPWCDRLDDCIKSD